MAPLGVGGFMYLYTMSSPIARLQALSEEEKTKLFVVLKRKLLVRLAVFFFGILLSLAITIYFNNYSGNSKIEDNLGLLNVFFIVIIVLCARLIYAEVLDYGKEIGSPNKKIIHTKIAGRQDGKIILGNKSFSKEDLLLDNSDFDSLKGGDDVVLELSAKSNIIFSVKKALRG